MNEQFTWLHIGLGSFHRAHQAWYLHRLQVMGDKRWSIAAGNIRNDAEHVVQALSAQKGRYVLETVSPEGVWMIFSAFKRAASPQRAPVLRQRIAIFLLSPSRAASSKAISSCVR